MAFELVNAGETLGDPFKLIGDDWMLITAGDETKCNTMTAAWGGVGFLWKKPVTFAFIRPQRYTKEFVDNSEGYSLCFFDEEYKKTLGYLGKISGRDEDKIAKSNLTTAFCDGVPYFEQARLVIICKKLYKSSMAPENFIDKELDALWYPDKDYHDSYVGEIIKTLKRI